jgi:hypothetical protein
MKTATVDEGDVIEIGDGDVLPGVPSLAGKKVSDMTASERYNAAAAGLIPWPK